MQGEDKACTIEEALAWILAILGEQEIPYQLVGGTAIHVYGGTRPILDIDMYIPKANAADLASRVKDLVSKPLKHYVEDVWDIEYFQIIYKGQKIEFGTSPGAKIFDKNSGNWIEQTIDFDRSVSKDFGGLQLQLMPIHDLIKYKTILDRDVDRVDVMEMLKLINN